MQQRERRPHGRGVTSLWAVLALLVGLLAMHGVGASGATGVHHGPVTAVASTVAVSAVGARPHARSQRDAAVPHGEEHPAHDLAVGCLLATVGVVAVAVMVRGMRLHRTVRLLPRSLHRPPPAVPPAWPRARPRIALCVIRV